ncbi:hypothetical protein DPMN_075074 [Dreissena polymorpha]|uniref:Uncharacterized protein n=1 Tax=Dreissena polymorpha TaxID=45954 RepID=A0A9D3YKE7_DREPO|nr:hypothetical protein DPMN_075074 [Dreissena polymorpha]
MLRPVSVPIEQGSSPWETNDGYMRIQYYCTFIAPDVGMVGPGKATVSVMFDESVHDIEVSIVVYTNCEISINYAVCDINILRILR